MMKSAATCVGSGGLSLALMLALTGALSAIAVTGCTTTTCDNRLAVSGYEYIEEGDLGAAEHVLNAALDLNPDNSYALLNLGVVYEKTGRTADAREMYNRVVEIDSDDTASRTTVAAEEGKALTDIAKRNLYTLQ